MNGFSSIISANQESRPVERLRDARQFVWFYAFVGILLLATAWGVWIRFDGLGSHPLVDDEYFSVTSDEYILQKGVPNFQPAVTM